MPRGVAAASVAALTLWLTGCSPLTALNAFVPDEGFTANQGIAYGPNPRQALDVYTPVNGADPAPVVVFFYGGSWKYGSREQYRFVAEALTGRGYLAVIPDYRVYPDVTFPAFVDDGAGALRWVHDHIAEYGGDPGRVSLMGHSAGAYNAALLSLDERYLTRVGLSPETIRGVVGIAGPYAFDPLQYRSVRAIFAEHPDPAETRPITFADSEAPPMLLIHGGDDGTVYPSNSRALADRIERAGGEAKYVEIPDTGHIAVVLALAKPFRRDGGVFDTAMAFLDSRDHQIAAERASVSTR